jgi:hypothetical protein
MNIEEKLKFRLPIWLVVLVISLFIIVPLIAQLQQGGGSSGGGSNNSVSGVNTSAPGYATFVGGKYSSTLPTLSNGYMGAVQLDSNGRVLISSIANALPAGTNTIGGITNTGFSISGALPSGTNTIGGITNTGFAVNAALPAGTNTIGNVGISSALPTGTNSIGSIGNTSFNVNSLPSTSASYATSLFYSGAITSPTSVKGSAGNLYGYYIYNPNSSVCYVEFFNTNSVTLGTTNPAIALGIPATGAANLAPSPVAISNFSSYIYIASETTPKSGSSCNTGPVVNVWYQ